MNAPEIVCVGLATLDTVVAVSTWPERDGRVIVDEIRRAGGGPAATSAVTAARLGASVGFAGRVGNDESGEMIRQELAFSGVDVEHLAAGDGRTPESVIVVDRSAGTRAILHAPGPEPEDLADAALEAALNARWIHVDHAGWNACRSVDRSKLSVDAGNPITGLDVAGLGLYAPSAPALRDRYPGLDLYSAVRRALDQGAQMVAVTMGANGALAADRRRAWQVGPMTLEAVSTLGAGDVFHGALLAMLIEDRTLPDALRAANVAAALSCRALDARSAIPDRAELEGALIGSPPAEEVVL